MGYRFEVKFSRGEKSKKFKAKGVAYSFLEGDYKGSLMELLLPNYALNTSIKGWEKFHFKELRNCIIPKASKYWTYANYQTIDIAKPFSIWTDISSTKNKLESWQVQWLYDQIVIKNKVADARFKGHVNEKVYKEMKSNFPLLCIILAYDYAVANNFKYVWIKEG